MAPLPALRWLLRSGMTYDAGAVARHVAAAGLDEVAAELRLRPGPPGGGKASRWVHGKGGAWLEWRGGLGGDGPCCLKADMRLRLRPSTTRTRW